MNRPLLKGLAAATTASLLALGLLGLTAGAVLAGPESGVDLVVHVGDTETVAPGDPPTACTFHLHFQADEAISGAFDIHEGDEDGPVVESGLFETTTGDSRAPASGVYALANGSYTVTWDDEIERDHSFDEQPIEVLCEVATPTPTLPPTPAPTPTPTPTGSEQPGESETPTPTGSELPAESEGPTPTGNELPTGSVAGITVTPPATDASPTSPKASGGNAILPILAILGLAAFFLTSSQRLRRVTAKRLSRRR
jgi:outer membrane biosynthesis protein TonB